MAPRLIEYNEIAYDLEVSSEYNGNFALWKNRDAIFKRYYIEYPNISDHEFIGPFFTKRGAEKYAWSLKIDVDFEGFST